MIHFLDSSALVKRYVEEEGSAVIALLFRGRKTLCVSRLAEVEVPLAMARRARRGDLTEAEARTQSAHVVRDLKVLRVIELRQKAFELARELGWDHGLRAYDALQLACACRLKSEMGMSLTFWSADDHLNDAARAEGLRVGQLD
jgi:predicted nucleic acid-binding protein